jgi:hypothetical protein
MFFDPYAYDLTTSAGRPTLPGAGAALAADVLLDVPAEAQDALWQGLTEAVDGALDLWERLPAGGRRTRRPSPSSTRASHNSIPPICAVRR